VKISDQGQVVYVRVTFAQQQFAVEYFAWLELELSLEHLSLPSRTRVYLADLLALAVSELHVQTSDAERVPNHV